MNERTGTERGRHVETLSIARYIDDHIPTTTQTADYHLFSPHPHLILV